MALFAAANASRDFAQLRARIPYGARLASPSASHRSTFPLRAALSSACFLLRMTFKALCPENSLGLAYAELDPAGELETASPTRHRVNVWVKARLNNRVDALGDGNSRPYRQYGTHTRWIFA